MRSVRPQLPDDPSPEQVEAWIELAELVQEPGFRRRVREMSEAHSAVRQAGEEVEPPPGNGFFSSRAGKRTIPVCTPASASCR